MIRPRKNGLVKLGTFLKQAREALPMSQQDVAKELTRMLGRPFPQPLMVYYELGRFQDPDPDFLRALARIYRLEFYEIVVRLVQEKYRVRLRLSPQQVRYMKCRTETVRLLTRISRLLSSCKAKFPSG